MPTQDDPVRVLQQAFEAVSRRDWSTLANLTDRQALEELRQDALGLAILKAEQIQAGEKPEGGYNPNEVVIQDHLARVGAEKALGFVGDPTIGDLAALSPAEFFRKWCESAYGVRESPDPVWDVVDVYRRIIGEVRDASQMAHVLYRRESRHVDMGELKIGLPGRVAVMPLRKTDDKWRIALNDDLGWTIHLGDGLDPDPHGWPIRIPARNIPPNPPAPLASRVTAVPGPDQVVRATALAFERGEWSKLAAMVHPERLAAFQQEELAYLVVWHESRESRAQAQREGASVFMFSYDSLSADDIARAANVEVSVFSPPQTIGALAALSPRGFFEAWCRTVYRDARRGFGATRRSERRVIGHVFEGDSLAHVLYHSWRLRGADRMPLRWSVDGWRTLLNDDIGSSGMLAFLLNNEP